MVGIFSSARRKGGGELVQKVRQTTQATESSGIGGATQFISAASDQVPARSLPAAGREDAPNVSTSGVVYQASQPCADAFVSEVGSFADTREKVIR